MSFLKHLTGEDDPRSVTVHHFIKLLPYNQIRDYCLAVVKHGLPLPEAVARRLNDVMLNETHNQTTRRAWKSMVRIGVAEEILDSDCTWCSGTGTRKSLYNSDIECPNCRQGKVFLYKYTGPVC